MKLSICQLSWCFLLVLGLSSCYTNSEDIFVTGEGKSQRTVLMYLVGDNGSNDLSQYLLSDFNEMLEGMSRVDATKNNLLIYSQTKNDVPRLIRATKTKNKVVADTIYTYPAQNPFDREVMAGVISKVTSEYPAENYGMVFASHGEGWMPADPSPRWIGDYRGTYMDISELNAVLDRFPRFEFIFFDACYMQSVEVAYELRDNADFIISSPTEIPGPGAPYQVVVPLMFANKKNVAIDIANGYYEYYKDYKGIYSLGDTKFDWTYGVSVSVIKTSKLESLASATKGVLSQYLGTKEKLNVSSVFYYGKNLNSTCYYYDFDEVVRLITGKNEDYVLWRKAFDDVQPYFKTTSKNYANRHGGSFDMTKAEGIYVYVPQGDSQLNNFYHTLQWYNAGGWKEVGW